MRIRAIAVGTKMPAWVTEGIADYHKRLPREWSFEFVEIALGHRSKGQDVAKAMRKEGDQMLASIHARDYVIALDVKGKPWSTTQLSGQMSQWQLQGDNIALLIGGPDGLAAACVQRAQQSWSLSPLTLPHPLVRVLLTEQLYRSWTLLQNHPYHK